VAHKPDSRRTLSIKTKLLLIAIMFVVINLIFYFGFDSSDEPNESEKSIELDNANPPSNQKSVDLSEDIGVLVNP